MTTKEWNRIETIVDQVLDLPEKEREEFIRKQCGSDEALIENIHAFISSVSEADHFFNSSSTLKDKIADGAASEHSSHTDYEELIGETIGAYKLKQLLGVGGMGAVYLGSRADGQFDHTVAIKVIQHGLGETDIRARFLQERQILAGLSHENIARLYDGGLTEQELPYLIMEYVDGIPIDQYCDEHKLTAEQRIELFKSVCRAAQYAHKNLVIHRDLKPENILITPEEKVKVMDFGIARLVNQKRTKNPRINEGAPSKYLSFSNAAPEQISNAGATTATDIYALGILLYKLIAGEHPLPLHNKPAEEIRQVIKEENPKEISKIFSGLSKPEQLQLAAARNTTPAAFKKKWRRDFDSILLKCLHKDPEHRYQTVEDLLQDLRRFENHYPVKAHNSTAVYRIKKYTQRNQTSLTVGFSFLLLIILSVVFYTYQVQQERDIANLEANKANQVTEFVLNLFEGNNPSNTGGEDISARDLLNRGIERTEYLSNQPAVQANMLEVLGRILTQLGEYDKASKLLTKSIELRTEHLGESHIETIASHEYMGNLLSSRGDLFEARTMLEEAIENRKKLVGPEQAALAESNTELAYVYRRLGNFEEAEKIYSNLIPIYRAKYGENDPLTIKSISSLGVTLHTQGKLEEAEQHYRDVLERRIQLYDTAHPEVAMSYNNLGTLLINKGEFREAEEMLYQALNMRKTLFGEDHPKVSLTLNNIGILKKNTGDFEEALRYMNQALTINRDLFGENGLQTATNLFSLADLYMMTGNYREAFKNFQKSTETFKNYLPRHASFIARSMIGMGESMLHLENSNLDHAENYIQQGYDQAKNIHPRDSIEFGLASLSMGKLCLKTGKIVEGFEHLTIAYHIVSEIEGENSHRSHTIRNLIDKNFNPATNDRL